MDSAPTPSDVHPNSEPAKKAKPKFDPEEYRMSIGDHLEELRNRLFYGGIGFIVACIICFSFGQPLTRWFIKPLITAEVRNGINPQVYTHEMAESFMTYIKIVMICAAVMAGPWLLYQIWQFIAAGLYPKERKYITRYLPLSITLLISGMVFLFYYVLPLMLEFFLAFNLGGHFDYPPVYPPTTQQATTQPAMRIPVFNQDPTIPVPGTMWIEAQTGLLKICLAKGVVRSVVFGSNSLVTPQISMALYIDTVVGLLLSFGLAFQMPLIVLALYKVGIVQIDQLKKMRRVVYFGMSILAACIVPDVVTGMVALLIPLILLYELGILLARWSRKKETSAT